MPAMRTQLTNCGKSPTDAPKRITIRGSIVGARNELSKALSPASCNTVRAHIHHLSFTQVNETLDQLRAGKVDRRLALEL